MIRGRSKGCLPGKRNNPLSGGKNKEVARGRRLRPGNSVKKRINLESTREKGKRERREVGGLETKNWGGKTGKRFQITVEDSDIDTKMKPGGASMSKKRRKETHGEGEGGSKGRESQISRP